MVRMTNGGGGGAADVEGMLEGQKVRVTTTTTKNVEELDMHLAFFFFCLVALRDSACCYFMGLLYVSSCTTLYVVAFASFLPTLRQPAANAVVSSSGSSILKERDTKFRGHNKLHNI